MTGVQENKLAAVIDRFYEAAARPELWRDVLHEYALATGAAGAALVPGPDILLAPVCSVFLDEAVYIGTREGWLAASPRVARGIPVMTGSRPVITEAHIFTPEELDRLPWQAEFLDRLGFRSFAALPLVAAAGSSIVLSSERRKQQGQFQSRETKAIARAVPHLQRAGQLAVHLAGARAQGMLDAFDAMSCGALLLDRSGCVIRANTRAQGHFGRGLALTHGQLSANHRPANAELQKLIASGLRPGPAHEAPASGAVALPRPAGRPLVAHVAPLVGSARDLFQQARAVLLLIDPDEGRDLAEPLLRGAFGLTPAEARLARALALGRSLAEIAAAHGTTEGTTRIQLRAIFAKTGTRRQAELVALLARFAEASLPSPNSGSR